MTYDNAPDAIYEAEHLAEETGHSYEVRMVLCEGGFIPRIKWEIVQLDRFEDEAYV